MRATRPLCIALCLAAAAGCHPPKAPASVADVKAETLPSDPAELLRLLGDWSASHDRKTLENALVVADKLLSLDGKGAGAFPAAWLGARASFWLADDSEGDDDRRAWFGRKAAAYSERAIALEPKRVEGHYYRALGLGYVASTKSIGALDLVKQLAEEAKAALAADERFDDAGPHRLYGTLLLKAPGWPTSIGDPDEALDELKKAVTLAPSHPLNHFYYADALRKNDKPTEARAEYEEALKLAADDKWSYLRPRLEKEAREALGKVSK